MHCSHWSLRWGELLHWFLMDIGLWGQWILVWGENSMRTVNKLIPLELSEELRDDVIDVCCQTTTRSSRPKCKAISKSELTWRSLIRGCCITWSTTSVFVGPQFVEIHFVLNQVKHHHLNGTNMPVITWVVRPALGLSTITPQSPLLWPSGVWVSPDLSVSGNIFWVAIIKL